jgi:HK97 gp10 family phage protein
VLKVFLFPLSRLGVKENIMPAGVQFYLKGIDELERNANQLIKEVTEEKTKILLRAANKVKGRIKQNIQSQFKRHTGNLEGSPYATAYPEKVGSSAVAFAGIRPRKAPHGHLVEFGHGGPQPAPPHPFVSKSWNEMREEVRNDIASDLGKTIEKAV